MGRQVALNNELKYDDLLISSKFFFKNISDDRYPFSDESNQVSSSARYVCWDPDELHLCLALEAACGDTQFLVPNEIYFFNMLFIH